MVQLQTAILISPSFTDTTVYMNGRNQSEDIISGGYFV